MHTEPRRLDRRAAGGTALRAEPARRRQHQDRPLDWGRWRFERSRTCRIGTTLRPRRQVKALQAAADRSRSRSRGQSRFLPRAFETPVLVGHRL